MDKNIYLNLIESVYIIYMFNYFKTRLYIHHPFEYLLLNESVYSFLKHPISSIEYENKICPLGNLVGYIFAIWIFLRNYFESKIINKVIIYLILIGSLILNLNAFIYFIPLFIYEILIIN